MPIGSASVDELLALFHRIADGVEVALNEVDDWGLSGRRPGQYSADLVADEVVLKALDAIDVGVLSEETGARRLDRDVVVIVDPLDGSTNASRGIAHHATALCAVDDQGPVVALVAHHGQPVRWHAVRGGGAFRNRQRIPVGDSSVDLARAVVLVSGPVPSEAPWWQSRVLGAGAIDLCLVADGTADGFVDMSPNAHGVWDYAASMLVCQEAGVDVVDAGGRDLLVLEHDARRTPVAGRSGILPTLLAVRGRLPL